MNVEELLQKIPGEPAHIYYLIHQIIVSLLIGLVILWIGQILAWLFWAPVKHRLSKVNKKNAELRSQLEGKS